MAILFEEGAASVSKEPPSLGLQRGRVINGIRGGLSIGGVRCNSIAEAALALLLEDLVEGFTLTAGETFQIPIGEGRTVDFCVHGILIEFHNLRFNREGSKFGDFRGSDEYHSYVRARRSVRGSEKKRKDLLLNTREKLKSNYYERRKSVIKRHHEHHSAELIVATNWQEFYHDVLSRFTLLRRCTEREFKKLLAQKMKSLLKISKSKASFCTV